MKQLLRAAVYCRVARSDEFALESQKDRVCQYADGKGYSIEAIIAEETGGNAMERDGLNRIMELARNGEIEVVATTNCSRLGRNTVGLIRFIKSLHSLGVEVDFMSESLMSPQLMVVMGAFAG